MQTPGGLRHTHTLTPRHVCVPLPFPVHLILDSSSQIEREREHGIARCGASRKVPKLRATACSIEQ